MWKPPRSIVGKGHFSVRAVDSSTSVGNHHFKQQKENVPDSMLFGFVFAYEKKGQKLTSCKMSIQDDIFKYRD